jgi:hypothetical protein
VPSPNGKKPAALLAKPAIGAASAPPSNTSAVSLGEALAASFRRFPAANLHQRLASAAKR